MINLDDVMSLTDTQFRIILTDTSTQAVSPPEVSHQYTSAPPSAQTQHTYMHRKDLKLATHLSIMSGEHNVRCVLSRLIGSLRWQGWLMADDYTQLINNYSVAS